MDRSYEDDHEAFAGSRVDQYVYVPTKEKKKKDPHSDADNEAKSVLAAQSPGGDEGNTIFSVLDQHADTLDGDVKAPLVIHGDTGSGKTGLFANWLSKRREHSHRDEFLFQHYVGCSKESFQLSNMLLRLETKLKEKFQLREMIVPETEHDLRWSLGRFLAAAAKKGSPARIVIIIDGVHQLECEGAAVGSLHWLPMELPPCVRFMVSTVEQDQPTSGMTSQTSASLGGLGVAFGHLDASINKFKLNSTFVELSRRGYPMLSMEPLGVRARHDIITEFLKMNPKELELAENQQYKIASAPATAQPLFLRSLLQSLKLASSMANLSIDELMDIYLPCQSAYELIDKNFEICFDSSDEEARDYLGKVTSVVYFSRNGLTETEIWGLVRMLTKSVPEDRVKVKIYNFLKAYTMIVQGMHSFSHAIYKDVVFARYIQSKGESTRWHYAMARYFSQLPPCDRKLQALPYHLEEAGSWSRVKNCLTDIEMFQLWWTPKFKKDFLKIWSQLTARQDYKKPGVGGAATTEIEETRKKRPTYDVVEEYVKSLDEYRATHTITRDETVADIILQIADFLIEFATLGLEEYADVPASIHPFIPVEDVKAIGVPYVQIGEDGTSSTLMYPEVLSFNTSKEQGDDEKISNEVPMATEENLKKPLTTYFFHRWMWIQFPYIALGNCGNRYIEGVNKMQESVADYPKKMSEDNSLVKKPATAAETRAAMSQSFRQSGNQKLPVLTFNRKAAKSIPRVTHEDASGNPPDKVALRLFKLQEDINNYREECDFLVNMKGSLNKRLKELLGTIEELKRCSESCNDVDTALTDMINRENDASKKFKDVSDKNKNLKNLMLMCERHPANVPALIQEIQNKIDQDTFLINEVKNRLWEQKFEKQTHNSCFKQMRKLAKEGAEMHAALLDYRMEMKRSLMEQAAEDQRRSQEARAKTSGSYNRNDDSLKNYSKVDLLGKKDWMGSGGAGSMAALGDSEEARAARWEQTWSIISSRTGITEPEVFFQRFNNSENLQKQIMSLKKTAESNLERNQKEMLLVEEEVEEVRLSSTGLDVSSTKVKDTELNEKTQRVRRAKERTETAEQLLQRVYGGFNHILEALGVPPREAGAPVPDMLHDINNVLDSLLEEREKQHQMGQQNNVANTNVDGSDAPGSRMLARDNNLSPDGTHRPLELEAALTKFEGNKRRTARIRIKSAGRTAKELQDTTQFGPGGIIHKGPDVDDEDPDGGYDDEGTWNRKYVKTQSQRSVRMKMREESKKSKLAEANQNK